MGHHAGKGRADMLNRLKRKTALAVKSWVFSLLVAVLAATSFKSAIADWNHIPTGSMEPTLLIGDRIFVNKLAYGLKVPYSTWHLARWERPHRGNIVVFFSPADGKRLVKRIIGIPGDTVAMDRNQVFLNGTPLGYTVAADPTGKFGATADHRAQRLFSEDLAGLEHPIRLSPETPSQRSFGPVRVPSGMYFVMGDNRDRSADSRYFGFVPEDQIVGQVTAVVLSWETFPLALRSGRSLQRVR
jgi:signal peptidase I